MTRFGFGLAAAGAAITMASAAGAETEAPRVDDIVWYKTDAHCSFRRAGHKLDSEDPESWRFVLLISRTGGRDGRATIETGYMKIDGILRQLRFEARNEAEGGETRRYSTYGDEPARIEVEMKPGGKEAEPAGYEGTISVIRHDARTDVSFEGDCDA